MVFYTQLGFTINSQFSDDNQKCMMWSEHIYVMLISSRSFESFSNSKKPIADTKKTTAVYFTLHVESIDKVNEIVDSGLRAGGIEPIPMRDYGFMQLRKIEDFDGHTWDVIFMDMSKFKKKSFSQS